MCRRLPGSGKTQQHPSGLAHGPPCASAAASAAPPGLWLLVVGAEGGSFSNRGKKKIICLQLTSSHSGWLQETCAPAARDTTVATATAKQGDSSTPSLCHPPPPQNKAEREGGDGETKQLVGMTLGSRGQGCYVLCSRPTTASARAPLRSHRS